MELSPVARRWSEILDEADSSGMDLRAFARARGLNRSTLGWWRWKLGRTEVRKVGASAFLEVTVEHAPAVLVVELRGGAARVRVDHTTDLGLLGRVLDALC